jgi:hypothetical protein
MGRLFKSFLILLLAITFFSLESHAEVPEIKRVPVVDVYSPFGFDSNDNTEIVVSGYLPNLCHQHPMTDIEVIGNTIYVEVRSYYYHPSNPYCPGVENVPFITTVSMGILPAGMYDIVVNKGIRSKKSKIGIRQATSDLIDESIYANIQYIEESEAGRSVNLVAMNFVDCLRLKEVRHKVHGQTISILPILEQYKGECKKSNKIQKYKFDVPRLKVGDKQGILLHVRKMDGRSVNHLYRSAL